MPGLDPSRVAVISAVLFSALFVAGALVVPAPPDAGSSGAEVVEYFDEHGDALRGSSYAFVLGGVAYAVFLVTIRRRINAKCSLLADCAFAGGLLLGAGALVATMGRLGLALGGEELDPESARTVFDVISFFEPVASGPVGLLAGAVAVAAFKQKVFPTWVGWVSAAYVAYEAVEAFTVYGTDGAFAPGDAINTIGTFLFVPWALVVAAGLARPAPVRDAQSQPA
jgi:hypothetical protein